MWFRWYKFNIYICIYFISFEQIEFWIRLMQTRVFYAVIRTEETKLVCVKFNQKLFRLKNIILWHKGVLQYSWNGLKLILNGPKWSALPSPSPASTKVSCQEASKLEKTCLRWFYIVDMKKTTQSGKTSMHH